MVIKCNQMQEIIQVVEFYVILFSKLMFSIPFLLLKLFNVWEENVWSPVFAHIIKTDPLNRIKFMKILLEIDFNGSLEMNKIMIFL